jgi:hypothetical protein
MKTPFNPLRSWPNLSATLVVVFALGISRLLTNASPDVFGVFVGSTPCLEPVRQLLQIHSGSEPEPELMEWKLTFYQEPKTMTPSRYELRCEYGLTAPGKPGLAKGLKTLELKGTWTSSKGTKSNPNATVYELHGAVNFLEVDSNVLHVLNTDRSLMLGTGGWSYTLNRAEQAEKAVDVRLLRSAPEMSYQISPLATGPTVFGIFEGRTPCHGIARQLNITSHVASTKVKWRVTLYQDPGTQNPTTYKVEGSLFRQTSREGNWTMTRGTEKDPEALVYRLASAKDEPALLLLKGDDNVLFFLDQKRKPLVGHQEFSYTLNRRSGPR